MNFILYKLKRILFFYFIIFIFYSIFVFLSFYVFNFEKILFYKGLFILFFNLILFLIFFIFYSFKTKFKNFDLLINSLILSFSIHLVFFVIFPVTFERSVTIYILNNLKNNQNNLCKGLKKSQLENNLILEYVLKNNAIKKRIEEQKVINFLEEKNNCILITSRGINFLNFSNIIKKLYNIN